jgi:hypothetical protein
MLPPRYTDLPSCPLVGATPEQVAENARIRVLAWLQQNAGRHSPATIRLALAMTPACRDAAIDALVGLGKVAKTGRTVTAVTGITREEVALAAAVSRRDTATAEATFAAHQAHRS